MSRLEDPDEVGHVDPDPSSPGYSVELPAREPELDLAVAERALTRVMNGTAICGAALGALALAFLIVSGGELGAQTVPQLVLLGSGWAAGMLLAGISVRLLRRLRAGAEPLGVCRGLDAVLRRAVMLLPAVALSSAALLVGILTPRGTTLLSVIVSIAILSQLVVVLLTMRSTLRRTLRRLS